MIESDPGAEQDSATGDDLIHGGLWTALSALLGVPLALLSNVVLARSLGPEDLGVFGQLGLAWLVVGLVVNTGISAATVQWLALSRGRRDVATSERVIRICSAYHLVVQGPLLAAVTVALLWSAPVWVIVSASASTLVVHGFGTASVVMIGAARNARAAQINIVFNAVRVGATIGAAVVAQDPLVVWGVIQVAGLLAPVLSCASLTSAERRLLFSFRPMRPWPSGFPRYARNIALTALATSLVFGRTELLVLGLYGQDKAAGYFVVATGIASFITVPMDSLMGPLAPAAAYYTGQSRARATGLLERCVALSAVLGGATAAAAPGLIAATLPVVYGSEFDDAILVAQVLAGLSLLQSVLNPMSVFALAAGRSGQLLMLSTACAAVDVALALVLVPSWGIGGAVVAGACAQLAHLAGGTELAARSTDLSRRSLVVLTAPLLLGLVIGGVAAAAVVPLHGGLLGSVAAAVVGFLAFRLCLHLRPRLRIPQQDWDRLLSALGPKAGAVAIGMRVLLGSA